jgi:hypothetical protein
MKSCLGLMLPWYAFLFSLLLVDAFYLLDVQTIYRLQSTHDIFLHIRQVHIVQTKKNIKFHGLYTQTGI